MSEPSVPIDRNMNRRAEKYFGKRKTGLTTDAMGSLPLQTKQGPQDIGFECPLHGPDPLAWSEYNGFVWCEQCEKDLPSCLCVNLFAEPPTEVTFPMKRAGLDDAIDIYIWAVEEAARYHGLDIDN